MGLFDKLKKTASSAADAVRGQQQPPPQPPPEQQQQQYYQQEPEPEPEQHYQLDIAGFDPDDEEAFYNAVLHMESEGQFGGTDESRAEIMQRYGIRDRSHWQDVKNAMYHTLMARFGTIEDVMQREMNWRSGQMQRHMQQQTANMAAGGGFEPVEGVTLAAWAAINASIIGGSNADDLLKGAGIDQARWQRVSAEWNARMSRDTTFAIATAYGNAFQAASQGQYGTYAREANAARAQNREMTMNPPISYEQYYEIMYEQSYAAKQGRDPVAALKQYGMSIVDWTDLGSYFGYLFARTGVQYHAHYEEIHKRVEAQMQAKYPGVQADVDISF